MLEVEHAPDDKRNPLDPILYVNMYPTGEGFVSFRWFDDVSAGVDISAGDESIWLCLDEEDTRALQAALNKAFPV